MHYGKYINNFYKDYLIKKFKEALRELDSNPDKYDGQYVITTIVPGSAGRYIETEFLQTIGYKESISEPNEFIHDTVMREMDILSDDFAEFFSQNGFDIENFRISVGYNEFDGAIDIFLNKNQF